MDGGRIWNFYISEVGFPVYGDSIWTHKRNEEVMLDTVITIAMLTLSGWLLWHIVWVVVDTINIMEDDK